MAEKTTTQKRQPHLWEAGLAMLLLMVVVSYSLIVLKVDAHIPFVFGIVIAAAIAMRTGMSWDELEDGMVESIRKVMSSLMIIMVIGMVIGSWVQGGIVPALIYYGLQIMNPRYFLFTICIICCIVSLATGSSYTTAGTMGIAAMGIGEGLGIPAPMVAGAVISGTYFGDKMSPLSDTTCLASAVNDVNIFAHVKHMIYTVTPALIISLVMYLILGWQYGADSGNLETIEMITTTLQDHFYISPVLLLPALSVIVMVILKVPAMPGIFAVAILGAICALVFQGASIGEVLNCFHYGFVGETGVEFVDRLLTRGGLDSMLWTISLIIIAVAFGGIMERSGMLNIVVEWLMKKVQSTGTLVALSLFSCVLLNIIAVDNYLAIVLTSSMFAQAYQERNLHPLNLSRVVEDAGSVTSPLVPWNTCALVMTGSLGVSAVQYGPYAFLNWTCPIISAIYGYTGFSMKKLDESKPIGVPSEAIYRKTAVAVASK